MTIPETKVCSKCKIEKSLDSYGKNKQTRFGVHSICKMCKRDSGIIYRRNNQSAVKLKKAQYYQNTKVLNPKPLHVCLVCKKGKILREYNPKDRTVCYPCKKLIVKPKYKGSQKQKDAQKRRAIERRKNPIYIIKKSVRSRLNGIIRYSGVKKIGSAVKSLNTKDKDLLLHIESKFTDGMNWGNYGKGKNKWSLDHYLPLAKFNIEIDLHFKVVNHYLNIRPLWNHLNTAKKDSWPTDYKRYFKIIMREIYKA